jgi:hypothetical protein
MKRSIIILAALSAALAAGCEGPATVYTDPGAAAVEAIPDKAEWSAEGNLDSPPSASDGDLLTIARTPTGSGTGSLVIDMGRPAVVQTIIVDHGSEESGYARRLRAAFSVSGRTWSDEYTVSGTRRVTILSLPKPVLARHIRLEVLGPGPRPWAVAEVFVQ